MKNNRFWFKTISGARLKAANIASLNSQIKRMYGIFLSDKALVNILYSSEMDRVLKNYKYADTIERDICLDAISINFTGLRWPLNGEIDTETYKDWRKNMDEKTKEMKKVFG